MLECTWAPLLPRSFGPRTSRSLLSATVGMKPTISGSNAFGVGPDQSPSDHYPPHVAGAESERPDADSPIGRPTPGELAHWREVSGIGLKRPKSVLLPPNSSCLAKADGSPTLCRNVVSPSGTRAFDGMRCASYT